MNARGSADLFESPCDQMIAFTQLYNAAASWHRTDAAEPTFALWENSLWKCEEM